MAQYIKKQGQIAIFGETGQALLYVAVGLGDGPDAGSDVFQLCRRLPFMLVGFAARD